MNLSYLRKTCLPNLGLHRAFDGKMKKDGTPPCKSSGNGIDFTRGQSAAYIFSLHKGEIQTMRMRNVAAAILAVSLCVPAPAVYAKGTWQKMTEWFQSKTRSTTVTGALDIVEGRKIMFKTDDGQTLELTGRKAEKIVEHKGATIRVFGNVRKPDAKFPTGGIEVRSFKVVEEAKPAPAPEPEPAPAPAPEPEPAPAPEPEPMPAPAPEPEPIPEPAPMPAVDSIPGETGASDKASTYVVQKGDTLAKISKKVYGTTKKWKKIAEANNLTNPKALKVGKTLQIP